MIVLNHEICQILFSKHLLKTILLLRRLILFLKSWESTKPGNKITRTKVDGVATGVFENKKHCSDEHCLVDILLI